MSGISIHARTLAVSQSSVKLIEKRGSYSKKAGQSCRKSLSHQQGEKNVYILVLSYYSAQLTVYLPNEMYTQRKTLHSHVLHFLTGFTT